MRLTEWYECLLHDGQISLDTFVLRMNEHKSSLKFEIKEIEDLINKANKEVEDTPLALRLVDPRKWIREAKEV